MMIERASQPGSGHSVTSSRPSDRAGMIGDRILANFIRASGRACRSKQAVYMTAPKPDHVTHITTLAFPGPSIHDESWLGCSPRACLF